MLQLMLLMLRLPFWLYFLIGAAGFYMAFNSYESALRENKERAAALEQPKPVPVALGAFTRDTDIHLAEEVHVTAQVDAAHTYTLERRTKGILRERGHMYVLVDPASDGTDKVVKAILVIPEPEALIQYATANTVGVGPLGPVFEVNGRAGSAGLLLPLVSDALRDEGLMKSPDFTVIEPFFEGREIGLKPRASSPMTIAALFCGLSVLSFVYGLFRLRQRRDRKAMTAAHKAMEEELLRRAYANVER